MDPAIEARFSELVAEWRKHLSASLMASNPKVRINCDAYRELEKMGGAIIPLVLREYRGVAEPWGALLATITGLQQFGNGMTGNLKATREAWLEWGKAHGHLA